MTKFLGVATDEMSGQLLRQELESPAIDSSGAALVGYDGETVEQALDKAKAFPDYSQLRAYSGMAEVIHITNPGVEGFFQEVVASSPVDNGATRIVDSAGRVWDRVYEGVVYSSWFGTVADGVADDTAALQRFWSFLATNGLDGQITTGTYKISSQILTQLSNSFSVMVESDAEFVAAVGFPSGQGMFAVGNALVPGRSFKWVGGRADLRNQPFTNDGSGSGCSFLTVNASNCTYCHVEIDRTYSGDDWLNTGSDSHLFIGGPSNVYARIHEAIGAPDSAIYISRNIAGTTGQTLDVGGNFYKCNVGVIVKRRYETVRVVATATDCVTGAASGTADISGQASANAGHGYTFEVNAKRTEHPVYLNAVANVQVFVNAELMGVSIPGYTSPSVAAVYCRGATGVQGIVNVHGTNPALTADANFAAVFLGPITTTLDGTLESSKNQFDICCSGLGVPFIENGSGTNDNTFSGKLYEMVSNLPTVIGALTRYTFNVSNIVFKTSGERLVNAAGQTLFTLNEDGSIGIGLRNSGSTNLAYADWFSGAAANRTARDSVTGGTSSADSGTRTFQAAAFNFIGASIDFNGNLRASVDIGNSIGSAARRMLNTFSQNFRPGAGTATWTSGAGTPEGAVTATPGSLYTRTDGAANTTLYIKETGAAATGWVAK